MAVFEQAKQNTDREVMLKLLTSLSENPECTQRDLASEFGISLGMMVSYMKNSVKKGFVRAKQINAKRWAYFVTPKGFTEKSIMVSDYVARSLSFYKNTRLQLERLFNACTKQNLTNIALVGSSEISEIATLIANAGEIKISLHESATCTEDSLKKYDAVLVTDVIEPQNTFDKLKSFVEPERLLCIDALCISRRRINIDHN